MNDLTLTTENLADSEDFTSDLYEHYRIVVDPGQEPFRIDKYLTQRLPYVSRSKIQHAIKAEAILVNDHPIKSNYLVKPHDVIRVLLPRPPVDIKIFPQNIPIDMIYEDRWLIIVNKKPGMVVHPGYNNYDQTLLHALLYHFEQHGETHAQPYLVHRIDKDTSGLIVVAKDEYVQTHLARQFFEHSIQRKYIALIWGNIDTNEGVIEGYLSRNPKDRRKIILHADENKGKYSKTFFRVLERFDFMTLVECQLATGRTHQIRAHFASIKHPLFGDPLYGGNEIIIHSTRPKFKQFISNLFSFFPRQALHAKELGFFHPILNQNLLFSSSLPPDFQMLINKIHAYINT
ncbi:MAG: RluA family pseudouridine synthase [Bacteroidales bacterium]|nr:RluA family pseudouridine synthase [Bacteroidales bacterium]